MDKVKTYKVKLTSRDRKNMEATLLNTSQVYKWLREAKVSKNKLVTSFGIRWSRLYETFRHPKKHMTLQMIVTVTELLPDKDIKDVLMALAPEYSKPFYAIENWELEELENKFKKDQ